MRLGRYELLEPIGKGGMAVVHRGVLHGEGNFRSTVAVKRMLPQLIAKPEMVERFVREATIGAQLSHPNVARVHEFGSSATEYFIALEFVDGFTLSDILHRSTHSGIAVPVPVVLSILRQLASALAHVHERADESGLPLGLVHRDISPSNIMISHAGHLKLIDFGVASTPDAGNRCAVGKLAYMAPEAITSAEVEPGLDIWGFGVVAWEMVTSQRLFSADSDYEMMQKVRNMSIPSPSELEPTCPLELDLLVLSALTRPASARSQGAAEIVVAIDDLAACARLNLSPSAVAKWLSRVESKRAGRRRDARCSQRKTTHGSSRQTSVTVEIATDSAPTRRRLVDLGVSSTSVIHS